MSYPKIQPKNFKTGILIYALIKQFQRVTDKIEDLFDQRTAISKSTGEIEKAVEYYKDEKTIVLAELKKLLVEGCGPVPEKKKEEKKAENNA